MEATGLEIPGTGLEGRRSKHTGKHSGRGSLPHLAVLLPKDSPTDHTASLAPHIKVTGKASAGAGIRAQGPEFELQAPT